MRFAKIKQMLLIPFAALLMLVALSMPGQAQAASKKTYIIGTDQTFKPFEIQDKDGTYNGKNPGIDIEILQEIAKHENFKYELKIMSFNADVQALQSGQIDGMIAGMSVTEERKKTIDFSNSYYTDGVCLAVAKDSKITSMKDLKGKTVNASTMVRPCATGLPMGPACASSASRFPTPLWLLPLRRVKTRNSSRCSTTVWHG